MLGGGWYVTRSGEVRGPSKSSSSSSTSSTHSSGIIGGDAGLRVAASNSRPSGIVGGDAGLRTVAGGPTRPTGGGSRISKSSKSSSSGGGSPSGLIGGDSGLRVAVGGGTSHKHTHSHSSSGSSGSDLNFEVRKSGHGGGSGKSSSKKTSSPSVGVPPPDVVLGRMETEIKSKPYTELEVEAYKLSKQLQKEYNEIIAEKKILEERMAVAISKGDPTLIKQVNEQIERFNTRVQSFNEKRAKLEAMSKELASRAPPEVQFINKVAEVRKGIEKALEGVPPLKGATVAAYDVLTGVPSVLAGAIHEERARLELANKPKTREEFFKMEWDIFGKQLKEGVEWVKSKPAESIPYLVTTAGLTFLGAKGVKVRSATTRVIYRGVEPLRFEKLPSEEIGIIGEKAVSIGSKSSRELGVSLKVEEVKPFYAKEIIGIRKVRSITGAKKESMFVSRGRDTIFFERETPSIFGRLKGEETKITSRKMRVFETRRVEKTNINYFKEVEGELVRKPSIEREGIGRGGLTLELIEKQRDITRVPKTILEEFTKRTRDISIRFPSIAFTQASFSQIAMHPIATFTQITPNVGVKAEVVEILKEGQGIIPKTLGGIVERQEVVSGISTRTMPEQTERSVTVTTPKLVPETVEKVQPVTSTLVRTPVISVPNVTPLTPLFPPIRMPIGGFINPPNIGGVKSGHRRELARVPLLAGFAELNAFELFTGKKGAHMLAPEIASPYWKMSLASAGFVEVPVAQEILSKRKKKRRGKR